MHTFTNNAFFTSLILKCRVILHNSTSPYYVIKLQIRNSNIIMWIVYKIFVLI